MEAISRSCLPAAAARTKRQRKATCCGVLGAASHRTTCSRSSAAKLTSGLILAMRTHISYWPQYVYLFMIHTTKAIRHATSGEGEVGELERRPLKTGQNASVLVAFAGIGGTPVNSKAGKATKLPLPATALMPPPRPPAKDKKLALCRFKQSLYHDLR